MNEIPEITLEHCHLPWDQALELVSGWRESQPGGRTMDPKAQLVGTLMKQIRPPDVIPTPEESRAQLRKAVELMGGTAPALARREDVEIPGPAGTLRLRLYDRAAHAGPRPVVLFVHGGGWVQGDLDTHDAPCARIAAWSDAMVLSLDYRLAPEHKFPAAVDDVAAAYRWLRRHGAAIGADPTRVAVAGDSAGGNLCAVLCQQCARENLAPPRFQVLVYPAMDLAWETSSCRDMPDAYVLPRARLEWYVEQYLGSPHEVSDPRVSPLRAPSLAGQPPALVITCGFDPLRDDGRHYAERLAHSGASVTYHEYPGQIHAFFSLAGAIPEALHCQREIADFVRRGFDEGLA
ncbi:MAG: alpha/beta hydrolase [Gammaproteobacteria bacterium]|nr:alpha/beta hydrolase [Gammaproteobacteria bacterium]